MSAVADTTAPGRQPSYRRCFVCGSDNPIGLKVTFFQDERQVWTEFTPGQQHQGYPGITHGGIIYTLLDETIGRVAFIHNKWVVTARMQVRYRQPVPVGQKLRIEGEIVRLRGRALEAAGRALLPDGTVAAEAQRALYGVPAQYRQECRGSGFRATNRGGDPMTTNASTIAEAANEFLATLSPQARLDQQQEVLRFTRWLGGELAPGELGLRQIETYQSQVEATGADVAQRLAPLRNFLRYLEAQGYLVENLAKHIKVRRSTSSRRSALVNESAPVEVQTLTPEGFQQAEGRAG